MTDTSWDVDAALDAFTPVETVAKVSFDGKLVAAVEAAEVEFENMNEDDPGRQELAQRIVTMTEQLRASEKEFVVQAVGDLAWEDLITAHPAKDDVNPYDMRTFPQAAVAACCYSPPLSLEQAQRTRETLAPSQWRRLWIAVRLVNEMGDGVGKSVSGSVATAASATKSSTATTKASRGRSSSAAL